MFIDSLSIIYSPAQAKVDLPAGQEQFIDGIGTILKSVGWTQINAGKYKASQTIVFGLGAPTYTPGGGPPVPTYICAGEFESYQGFINIGGTPYQFYNPDTEIPLGGCIPFALGVTSEGTLNNLASVIGGGFTGIITTSGFDFILTITADIDGPAFNNIS